MKSAEGATSIIEFIVCQSTFINIIHHEYAIHLSCHDNLMFAYKKENMPKSKSI